METMTISAFKARISEQLRKVRRGASIIIADRDRPIALVSPMDSKPRITIHMPGAPLFAPPPAPPAIDHDPLEYLLEERGSR
jgi:antitoxin (DNA-binding transcriptional repressor) of toxin-antitoxin stability system